MPATATKFLSNGTKKKYLFFHYILLPTNNFFQNKTLNLNLWIKNRIKGKKNISKNDIVTGVQK